MTPIERTDLIMNIVSDIQQSIELNDVIIHGAGHDHKFDRVMISDTHYKYAGKIDDLGFQILIRKDGSEYAVILGDHRYSV